MNNSGEPSNVTFAAGEGTSFLVRWRGKQEGPYPAEVIENKLSTNEIGLLHEILHNGQWITIRDYLAEREATVRAQRQAREEQERREREEADRYAREVEAQQRAAALAEEKRRNDLQATAPKPQTQGGMSCPHCGSHSVGKVRGLQGIGEVFMCIILVVLFFIPGIIYYIYMESVPYCSGCGRRV